MMDPRVRRIIFESVAEKDAPTNTRVHKDVIMIQMESSPQLGWIFWFYDVIVRNRSRGTRFIIA